MDLKKLQKRLDKSEKMVKELRSFVKKAAAAAKKKKKTAILSYMKQLDKYYAKMNKKLEKEYNEEIADLKKKMELNIEDQEKQLNDVMEDVNAAAQQTGEEDVNTAAQQTGEEDVYPIEEDGSNTQCDMPACDESAPQESDENTNKIDSLLAKAQKKVSAASKCIDDLSMDESVNPESYIYELIDYATACQLLSAAATLEAAYQILQDALEAIEG